MNNKTIWLMRGLNVVLISAIFITFSAATKTDTSREKFDVLLGQVSYLSEEYSRTSEEYQDMIIGRAALQVNYNNILAENVETISVNLDYKEQIEDLSNEKYYLVKERDALLEANYNFNLSTQERLLLSQILYTEAQTESLEGKLAVIQTIMNRVADSRFPNTIEEVIKQPEHFAGYEHYNWGKTSNLTDYAVYAYADLDLRADGIDETILYFYSSPTTTFLRSLVVEIKIGKHYFCADWLTNKVIYDMIKEIREKGVNNGEKSKVSRM